MNLGLMEIFHSFLPNFMMFVYFVFFVLLIYNWRSIKEPFGKIGKKTWIILFVIIIFSFFVRFFWIPHEQVSMADGENWTELGIRVKEYGIHAQCDFDTDEECKVPSYIPYPPAYSTLLSFVFNFFETTEKTAFKFNALMGTLSVFIAFLFGYLYTKREYVALFSAFVFSLIPPLLKFSGGVSPASFSVFFLLLTFVFLKIFSENKSKRAFLLLLSSLLIVIYIRPENIFLAPIFLLMFAFEDNIKRFLDREKVFFVLSFFVFSFSLIPSVMIVYFGSNIAGYEGWNPSILETAEYLLKHAPRNFYFLINPLVNSFVFSFFVIIGTIGVFLKEKKDFFLFSFILLFYFTLYSSFDAGIFWGPLARYSLPLYVPLFFFFIKGINYVLEKIKNKIALKVILIGILFLFILSMIPTIPYIITENGKNANLVKETLLLAKDKIPEDAYLISNVGSATRAVINRKVVSVPHFENNSAYFENKDLFVFKNEAWFGLDGENYIYENYRLKPVETVTIGEREKGVYELIRK